MTDKYRHIIYEIVIFAMIYYLGINSFKDQYLFGWLVFNYKFFLVVIAIPLCLALFNQKLLSSFTTAGITIGVFVGNFGGALLRSININKITNQMSAQEVAQLHKHEGFYIMLVILIISFIAGLVFQLRDNKIGIRS